MLSHTLDKWRRNMKEERWRVRGSMPSPEIDRLTGRERECLRLVAQGFSSKDIAQNLGISPGRAAKVIDSANRKLGVSRRLDAARLLAAHEGRQVNVVPGMADPLPTADPDGQPFTRDEASEPIHLREERLPFTASPKPTEGIGAPFRRAGTTRNELSTRQRLAWILVLTAVSLLGIGVLARGVGSLSNQIILVPSQGR